MRGTVHLTSLSLLTDVISLSQYFPLIESHENTITEFFFRYLSKCDKYIFVVVTALQVNTTLLRNTEMWIRSIMLV